MSILPKAPRVSSTSRCRSAFEEMLAGTAIAAPGCFSLIAAATASQAFALREEMATLSAVLGQAFGDRLADTLGRAGDDGDLSRQIKQFHARISSG